MLPFILIFLFFGYAIALHLIGSPRMQDSIIDSTEIYPVESAVLLTAIPGIFLSWFAALYRSARAHSFGWFLSIFFIWPVAFFWFWRKE